LSWSLDFNVNPMCSIIAQVREEMTSRTILTNEKLITVEVLREICLPHSNTREACAEFVAAYRAIVKGHRSEVWIYGDATANRRDTRGTDSDWEIVFRSLRDESIPFRSFVTKANPLVRSRANSMNHALLTPDGVICLVIDPRCRELRTDLKEVRWKRDAAGNSTSQLDNSDPARTHVSDALGYLIHARFALTGGGGEREGLMR